MDNKDTIKELFIQYFSNHVKSIYLPARNPYNGNVNIKDYMEVKLNMEEWNVKYKKYPTKDDVKGLQVIFQTDEIGDEFEIQTITGFIKDYKLCQYGYECIFIIRDFSIKKSE